MSLKDAQAFAFSLAATLMVAIVIFRAGDGSLSLVPTNEFDGDDSQILVEIVLSPDEDESRTDFCTRRS
ncbi:hypothetical protein [Rhodoblastus sp.]|jgi:hypothetical protein|uniref:hypothetical protein n=1 Tax=Rhodoblastus sp. TaxID=1962975 RepID=UPI0025D61420|nr:hypothetical protein [Rhodoblastus sp.]